MPKQNLASMSVAALVKLRDEIGMVLGRRADLLKKELASLGADYAEVGRIAVYGRKKRRGRKAQAKYRDPKTGETWSGRGATARWLAAHEKQGRKRDDFLIAKPGKRAKKAAKKARRKKRGLR